MDLITERLRYGGHEAYRIASASEALGCIEKVASADIVVLDIIMSWPESPAPDGLSGARTAGMEVLKELRSRNQRIPIIAYSAIQDATIIEAISDDPNTSFLSKWEVRSIRELVHEIHRALGFKEEPPAPQPFIVHGHNEKAKLALKDYLQNTLHLPEPIVLHEKPNLGRTIVEKFEDYAAMSSLIFVLLTPDDEGASACESDDAKRRARQNVIFEMGYFLGMLGRGSGRVLLLHQGPLELPNDLSGVVYIDISEGVEAAGENIRREVDNVEW
jgi:CheY-like chemotaxis protein